MVPYWIFEDKGLLSEQTNEHQLRSICLAYIDSDIIEDDRLAIDIRGKLVDGRGGAVPSQVRGAPACAANRV